MKKPEVTIKWRTEGDQASPGTVAVVVDVLRASTSLTTACARGAKAIRVTTDIEAARRMADGTDDLLMGERHNRVIDGFDFGNSPAEIFTLDLAGKAIVFTSTNFPHALNAASLAGCVLIGALVNVVAVAEAAWSWAIEQGCGIDLILAGEPSEARAGEDHLFAHLAMQRFGDRVIWGGGCEDVRERFGSRNAEEGMALSIHAAELREDGFGQDVDFALRVDCFDTVPCFSDGLVA